MKLPALNREAGTGFAMSRGSLSSSQRDDGPDTPPGKRHPMPTMATGSFKLAANSRRLVWRLVPSEPMFVCEEDSTLNANSQSFNYLNRNCYGNPNQLSKEKVTVRSCYYNTTCSCAKGQTLIRLQEAKVWSIMLCPSGSTQPDAHVLPVSWL